MVYFIVGLIGWSGFSVLTYGYYFGYFQRKYPLIADKYYKEDREEATVAALTGPFGLIVILLMGAYKYGMKFK